MICNIINKIDKILELFFKNLNSLSYNLFNFLKNILNLKELKIKNISIF